MSACRYNLTDSDPGGQKMPRNSNREKCTDAEKGCGMDSDISLFSNRDDSRELNYRRNAIGGPRRTGSSFASEIIEV